MSLVEPAVPLDSRKAFDSPNLCLTAPTPAFTIRFHIPIERALSHQGSFMNRIFSLSLIVSLLSACSSEDDSGPAVGQPDANPPGDGGVPPKDGSIDSPGEDGHSGEDGG